jgi:hypothetical protein
MADQPDEEKTKAEAVEESEKKRVLLQEQSGTAQTDRGNCGQSLRQIGNSEYELQLQIDHQRKLLSDMEATERTAGSGMKTLASELSKMQTDFERTTAEHEAGKMKLDRIETEGLSLSRGLKRRHSTPGFRRRIGSSRRGTSRFARWTSTCERGMRSRISFCDRDRKKSCFSMRKKRNWKGRRPIRTG